MLDEEDNNYYTYLMAIIISLFGDVFGVVWFLVCLVSCLVSFGNHVFMMVMMNYGWEFSQAETDQEIF